MSTSRPSRRAARVMKATMAGLFTAGIIALGIAGPAAAGGTSSSDFNCYTQWWNTAWAQKCYSGGADTTGNFQSGIECTAQFDKSFTKWRVAYSTATYSGVSCTFAADKGWLHYLGY